MNREGWKKKMERIRYEKAKLPLDIRFNPYYVKRVYDDSVQGEKKAVMLKESVIDMIGADFTMKGRGWELVAARAAFLYVITNNMKVSRKLKHGSSKYELPMSKMAEIVGLSNHATVIHHVKSHVGNYSHSGLFGDYYRAYYKIFDLTYKEMFMPPPNITEKKALIGMI